MSTFAVFGWLAFQGCAGGTASVPPVPPANADATPTPPVLPSGVAATWNGGNISFGDLGQRTRDELRAMDIEHALARYELQSQALDTLVIEQLLTAEAKRAGHSNVDALLAAEVEAKVPRPSEEQIAAFYPVVERQLQGASLDEARPFLQEELLRQAQQEAYTVYLADLRKKMGVAVNLAYPDLPRIEIPVEAEDPVRGAANAPVTIVQFAEYQCYYCNQVTPTLDALMAKYEGKIRLVFKDFPLQGHGRAMPAAVAAHCAGEQGRYWDMNRVLLANQQDLGDADFARYATQIGADTEKFQTCLASNQYEGGIAADIDAGRRAGVNATPAFFVDGIMLSGAQPIERFEAVIDRELAAGRPPG